MLLTVGLIMPPVPTRTGRGATCFVWVPTKENEDDRNKWQWGGTLVVHEVYQRDHGQEQWIDGKVYDVTAYTPDHPAGKALLKGCGKDATEFNWRSTNACDDLATTFAR